ncbi:TetR/AcrR family transcriptional regulator [Paenibacillus sp. D51F]
MARPKEFDPAKALDQALEAFWDQGYEAASVQGLCSAMGINRGSLYDTFGDKETLFTACMDRFRAMQEQGIYKILERRDEDPREQLRLFFDAVVESSLVNFSRGRGCFMTNTTLGSSVRLPSIAQRVEDYQLYTEDVLLRFLEDASRRGWTKEGLQPREAASLPARPQAGNPCHRTHGSGTEHAGGCMPDGRECRILSGVCALFFERSFQQPVQRKGSVSNEKNAWHPHHQHRRALQAGSHSSSE